MVIYILDIRKMSTAVPQEMGMNLVYNDTRVIVEER
jgi:hypothetical protein